MKKLKYLIFMLSFLYFTDQGITQPLSSVLNITSNNNAAVSTWTHNWYVTGTGTLSASSKRFTLSNCINDDNFVIKATYSNYTGCHTTREAVGGMSTDSIDYAFVKNELYLFKWEYLPTPDNYWDWVQVGSKSNDGSNLSSSFTHTWYDNLSQEEALYRVELQKEFDKTRITFDINGNETGTFSDGTVWECNEHYTFRLKHEITLPTVSSMLTANGVSYNPNSTGSHHEICGPATFQLENITQDNCSDLWIMYLETWDPINSQWISTANTGSISGTPQSTESLSPTPFSFTQGNTYRITLKVGNSTTGLWSSLTGNMYTFDYKQTYTPTISGPNSVCIGSSINLQVSGYSPSETNISWSNGQTGSSATISPNSLPNPNPIVYTVSFSEACTQSPLAKTVVVNSLPTLDLSANDDTYCANDPFNWPLSASPVGGTWTESSPWTSGIITPPSLFNGSSVGQETVGDLTYTYTDANGCTNSEDITIGYYDETIVTMTITDALCNGFNGTLTGLGSGNPANLWNVFYPSGSTTSVHLTNNLNNFQTGAGDYEIQVENVYGCTTIENVTINEPVAITGSLLQPSVLVNCNGEQAIASINTDPGTGISGGTTPYSYNFGFGWSPNTSASFGAIGTSSSYSISVTDANNCPMTPLSFTVSQPLPITFIPSYTNAECQGVSDGEITWGISNTYGGTGQLNVSMTGAGSVSSPIQGLASGQYQVHVTDANGCSKSENVTVGNNPTVFTLTGSPSDAACTGVDDGLINLAIAANGGSGNNSTPYSVNWSNGETSNNIIDLQAGTYNVTVTGQSGTGCIQTGSYQVGNVQASTWHKNTENVAHQQDEVIKILTDGSGNVYTLGEFTEHTIFEGVDYKAGPEKQKAIFISKHDACGGLKWFVHSLYNGSSEIGVEAIDMQFDGTDLLVFGKYEADGLFDFEFGNQDLNSTGGKDVFKATISTAGIVQGFTSADYYDLQFEETITQIHQYGTTIYFAGAFGSIPFNNLYAGIQKLNGGNYSNPIEDLNFGNVISAFDFDGTNIYAAANLSVSANINSTTYSFTGNTEALLLKYDGTNTTRSQAMANTDVRINDILLANGSLWIAGQFSGSLAAWGSPNANNPTAFVMESFTDLDVTGFHNIDPNLIYTEASANTMAANSTGLYVAGTFNGAEIAMDAATSSTIGSGANDDLWMGKLDFSYGGFVWIEGSASDEPVIVNTIAVDGNGLGANAFVGGSYANDITLPGLSLSHPLSGPMNNYGYIIREGDFVTQGAQGIAYKTGSEGNNLNTGNTRFNSEQLEATNLGLFPNPNNGTFTLRYSADKMGEVNITIFDITGHMLFSEQSNKDASVFEHNVVLSSYMQGIYLVALEINGITTYQKFIIE